MIVLKRLPVLAAQGILATALVGPGMPAWAVLQPVGNVVATTVSADQADFQLQGGAAARVQMLDSGLVRVRVNSTGGFQSWSTGAVAPSGVVAPGSTITDLAMATYLVTSQAAVVVLKNPFRIVILRADGSLVTADLPQGVLWDTQAGYILDQKFAPLDEHYFGLGERGGPVDRRGRRINMWNVDWAGYSEFTNPLYISIPYFYGLRQGEGLGTVSR